MPSLLTLTPPSPPLPSLPFPPSALLSLPSRSPPLPSATPIQCKHLEAGGGCSGPSSCPSAAACRAREEDSNPNCSEGSPVRRYTKETPHPAPRWEQRPHLGEEPSSGQRDEDTHQDTTLHKGG